MSEYMLTGGYAWGPGSRMRGDANAVAATLARIKDQHGRVKVDGIKDAWQRHDPALRETMGDEAHVLDIGLDHLAYKILGGLEYERVNVRTEDVEPAGRVFQPLSKVAGNPDLVRVFVETPPEAIRLGSLPVPPVAPPVAAPDAGSAPTASPASAGPVPVILVPDRDMEAWVALMEWRDRYGDLDRYQPIIEVIESLYDD